MKKSFFLVGVFWVLLIFLAGNCFGAGFALYEWSSRGNALGGTLIGRADDVSTIAYNPAGLTSLPGIHAMFGLTAIAPKVDVKANGQTVCQKDNIYFPPHFYLSTQLGPRYWIGIGEYSRFGLATDFPADWIGRFNAYYSSIKSYSIVPTLGIKFTDNLSLGFGFEVMYFEFIKKQKKNLGALGEVDSKIKGDSVNYGFTIGLHYKPLDWLKIGAVYRSQVDHTVKGKATFDRPATLIAVHPDWFRDTTAQGDISLPESYALGLTVYPVSNLSIEADIIYTRWSSYKELVIEYGDDLMPPTGANVSKSKKDWKDCYRFQLGLEYQASKNLSLRASYIYDQTPIPDAHIDYMLPANNRHLFGLGMGYKWNALTIDISYNYLQYENRKIDARPDDNIYAGKLFNGHAHLVGLSVGYQF